MTGPQGGYLAKRCPEAVQLDVLRPVEPLPSSDFMTMLADGGIAFEVDVFDVLRSCFAAAVDVDRGLHRDERARLTAEAMDLGAPLVIGGRLPVDFVGRRVGEPDLLLRIRGEGNADGGWPYVAVDVKNHIVRDGADPAAGEPWPMHSGSLPGWPPGGRGHRVGPLALRRPPAAGPLPAAARGLRPPDRRGPLGRHHRRRTESWPGTTSTHPGGSNPSTSSRIRPGPSRPWRPTTPLSPTGWPWPTPPSATGRIRPSALLAEPILIPACAECGWRVWCYPRLEESADLSLLQGMDLRKRRLHHERGVTDLHDLAGLDDRTARLIEAGVNLGDLMERATAVDPQTTIDALIPRRRRQITAWPTKASSRRPICEDLDSRTLSYRDSGMNDLAGQIDRVRARTGPHPAYRRRGVDQLDVPRGDIELDIDMENVAGGTYLWGVLRHRSPPWRTTPTVDYLPFVSWDPSAADGELDAFARFWALAAGSAADGRRTRAGRCGPTATARRPRTARCGGSPTGWVSRPKSKPSSPRRTWVDLYEVVQRPAGHRQRDGPQDRGPPGRFPLAG